MAGIERLGISRPCGRRSRQHCLPSGRMRRYGAEQTIPVKGGELVECDDRDNEPTCFGRAEWAEYPDNEVEVDRARPRANSTNEHLEIPGSGDGGVHADIPGDQPPRPRGPATRSAPWARCRPAANAETGRTRFARAHTAAAHPAAASPPGIATESRHQLPLAPLRPTTWLLPLGQQRLQHRALRVSQVRPRGHRMVSTRFPE
jgi:hypothetical protein